MRRRTSLNVALASNVRGNFSTITARIEVLCSVIDKMAIFGIDCARGTSPYEPRT